MSTQHFYGRNEKGKMCLLLFAGLKGFFNQIYDVFWQNIYSLLHVEHIHIHSWESFPRILNKEQIRVFTLCARCGDEATNKFGPLRSPPQPPPPPPTHPKFADLIRAGINCRAVDASAEYQLFRVRKFRFPQQINARALFNFAWLNFATPYTIWWYVHSTGCSHDSKSLFFSRAKKHKNTVEVKNIQIVAEIAVLVISKLVFTDWVHF